MNTQEKLILVFNLLNEIQSEILEKSKKVKDNDYTLYRLLSEEDFYLINKIKKYLGKNNDVNDNLNDIFSIIQRLNLVDKIIDKNEIYCKGSMLLETGCGKCKRCVKTINMLNNGKNYR